jgi:uncharacterized protein YaeQ
LPPTPGDAWTSGSRWQPADDQPSAPRRANQARRPPGAGGGTANVRRCLREIAMALKPTIYKLRVELADSDRHCYESLALTLAQHPSETRERLAVRLLAYCLNSAPGLGFTRGLSSNDEPDLWQLGDGGEVQHWIEVGQPEQARLRKACGRAQRIGVYAFGRSADTWWQLNGGAIANLPRLSVWQFSWVEVQALAALLQRTTQLSVSIAGGVLYIDNGATSTSVELHQLSAPD